jgi:hypothetical protein
VGGVAVDLPARLSTGVTLTGDLHATALGSGVRLGYDIWLTTSQGYSTAKTMEAHSSTYEIMVQPGRSGHTVSNTRWHRIYVSTPHAANGGVNLTSIIRSLHIPSSYYVEAVNAGAETNAGNFRVSSYWLKASFPATAGAGYNAHAVKSYKGVSASAWFYSYARRSGSGSTPAAAQASARSNAQWQAWHNAVIGADARAKSAAVHAWQVKHGYRWAPYVVGKRVSQAEYLLRRAGFHTWNYYVPRHRTGIVTSQGNRFVAPHAWIGLRYKVRK